ncbi:hypothetical protein AcetOrient_orf00168 [Acetobacter orientalis]|uniref:Uncharacterized protein n=1 Tax=Acetobacter orientalis TaxID=146474 RepID=A0A2Z5ZDI2_9PROT|nr:hypothetical protein AcetOrient_orf00168 [Acetobacter orientalis]
MGLTQSAVLKNAKNTACAQIFCPHPRFFLRTTPNGRFLRLLAV